MRASARPRFAACNAPSKSPGCLTSSDWSCTSNARAALRLSELRIGVIRIPQNGDARHPRRGVFEQLDGLSGQHVVDESEAGDVSSRPREARNEPAFDRIIAHDHDNRDSRGRFLDDRGEVAAERKDHVRVEAHQFIGQLGNPLVGSRRVAVLDDDGFSIDVAERFQPLKKRADALLLAPRKKQYADPPHPP